MYMNVHYSLYINRCLKRKMVKYGPCLDSVQMAREHRTVFLVGGNKRHLVYT